MLRSLSLLADFVECDPVWAPVRAFCGDSTLSSRIGGLQMQRLARRHGFEPVQPPITLSRHLQTIADSLIVWGPDAGVQSGGAVAPALFARP